MTNVTVDDLKEQRRWLLWRLEPGNDRKPTKVPYQPNWYKASLLNPAHMHTYAEVEAHVSNFSGIGLALGRFDGVYVWGVDFDKCCDAVTGKFTPEVRQVVIDLDTYSEYSPSGTGCHILGMTDEDLPIEPGNKRSVLVRPYPGCKQVEIKGLGFYFTFTGRHLSKTPADLLDRKQQLLAFYDRVAKIPKPQKRDTGLSVSIPLSEEERFQKLMAGDMTAYNDDHSSADFALCILLAKKYNCNAFKIDTEFRNSNLYRDKWDRDDYRETTITRAIVAVAKEAAMLFSPQDEGMDEDGPTEYLVDALPEPMQEGWFPKGEVSLIGGSSGAGKTSWAMPLLEKIRRGENIFGHTAKPREYRVLLHDRSKKAMARTAKALGLSTEAIQRVIRLTPDQQKRQPAEILQAAIEANPGVEVWFVEGLDLWIPDVNKMESVGPVIDGLQRISTLHNIAVLATVGSPKQKGKDKYSGRDSLFGSAALARKVETVVLMQLHDEEDPNSVRRCTVLPRNGRAERLYFEWQASGLVLTTEPQAVPELRAIDMMEKRVFQAVQPGDEVRYEPGFGSRNLFFDWKRRAHAERKVFQVSGRWYRARQTEAIN